MKKTSELKNLIIQTKRLEKIKQEIPEFGWIFKIGILSFLISFIFSFLSEMIIPNVNVGIGIFLVILFICIGIIFDMIGVAVTASSEKIFHSMNSRKIKGADVAVLFKKNANKVSSFCNDVIGDICGIVSGAAGVSIASKIAIYYNLNLFWVGLAITALIAALTISGKALGKSYAINKSNIILYEFAKVVSCFYKVKK